jgi:hypothetical protein
MNECTFYLIFYTLGPTTVLIYECYSMRLDSFYRHLLRLLALPHFKSYASPPTPPPRPPFEFVIPWPFDSTITIQCCFYLYILNPLR